MAYVPISYNLKYAIRQKIHNMCATELKTLGERPEIKPTDDECDHAIWGAYYHLKDAIPSEWKTHAEYAVVSVEDPQGKVIYDNYHYFAPRKPAPPRQNRTPRIQIAYGDARAQEFVKWHGNMTDVTQRWQNVEVTINKYLSSCKSLNEAVKNMEEIKHYVPDMYLKRLEEKRGKGKASAVEVPDQEEIDNLLVSVVSARLAGSQG